MVPNDKEIKTSILSETHRLIFAIHSGSSKMYRDIKEKF